MVSRLNIKNLAVIKDADISLDGRYIALIGETGAGKSLVVDSLELVSGKKGDRSLIREGEDSLRVVLTLDGKGLPDGELKSIYERDGELVIKRTLKDGGKSSSSINGEPMSLKELSLFMQGIIDIHSQGQNSEIFKESRYLQYIDLYSKDKIQPVKEKYAESYRRLQELKKELNALISGAKEFDKEYLEFQIGEIERRNLKVNEIEELEEEYKSLRSLGKVQEMLSSFQQRLQTGSRDMIEEVVSALSSLHAEEDSFLYQDIELLKEDGRKLSRDYENLKTNLADMESSAERIDYINSRLYELKTLQRKYGNTTAQILEKLESYKKKLSEIDDFESIVSRLETEIENQQKEALNIANKLSELRLESSRKLQKAISNEMKDLGLYSDGFEIVLEKTELNKEGIDRADFLVTLNKGMEKETLRKVISGGEASRLMLALKTVLNKLSPVALLVFDEIDTGVSGKIAYLIAKKIKSISSVSQVIVISHLPQVVACSDVSILVEKESDLITTVASARTITRDEKAKEIAKMISSDKVTKEALMQAENLIEELSE